MIPLVKDKFIIVLTVLFKFYGVEALLKVGKLRDLVAPVRRGIRHHFTLLTKDLEESGGPYYNKLFERKSDFTVNTDMKVRTFVGRTTAWRT